MSHGQHGQRWNLREFTASCKVVPLGRATFWTLSLKPPALYNTKIDGFVCPQNISVTVAVKIMKLAHHPRIASTMIKLISKPILLSILLKTIQRIAIVAAILILPTPFPVSVTQPRVWVQCFTLDGTLRLPESRPNGVKVGKPLRYTT